MKNILNIGIDVGSTTVKLVVMNNKKEILYNEYRRHYSDTKKTIKDLLTEITEKFPAKEFTLASTGSGAITLAKYLNIPFIQEVIACKNAIKEYAPSTDVAIELGGEDAKIIYFDQTIEQRMNGTCAGGTGAFLDQMAVLLNTDTQGLNEYAKNGKTIYPIASRCGVFAKTDIQPLLNEGAKKEDIALSILQAVVNQTISGLACGKPIKGNVIFLGGPLNYLTMLKDRFIKTLDLKEEEIITPTDARLFVCIGAILGNEDKKTYTSADLLSMSKKLSYFRETESSSLKPLFVNKKEYNTFKKRHTKNSVNRKALDNYSGDVFIGIDAGSTTAKVVAIDHEGNLLYENYCSNKGTPVDTVKGMLLDLYSKLPTNTIIRSAGSTGYGELLIKTAFNLDISEIETMAHYEAANYFLPGVESIIDIGGQDMKYIKIKDGAVDSIMLNEACSSGCGSFIETLAKSLNITVEEFVNEAVTSKSPIDLGSRCTVFMNSKIKQTQKEGYPLCDIFAGLSYSVIRNAIQKVMKIRDFNTLGNKIVVQGGTFLNNAILRAFEIIVGKEVVRPDIAGLMGAYGVALIALNNFKQYEDQDIKSGILTKEEIENLKIKTTNTRCQGCENHCALTINLFNKKSFISGNRCERGSGNNGSHSTLPNMYAWKYDRLFNYKPLENAPRGEIGIPRVLNMYENYPLWFTLFTKLGFKVVLSDHSNHTMYETGIESMPSESVCYPAKLVHGHIMNLIKKGVKTIFYPCIMYENMEFKNCDNHYNCPIVQSYSEAIKLNVENLEQEQINYLNPFLPLEEKALLKRIQELEEFKEYKFTKKELTEAINAAFEEQRTFKQEVRDKGEEFLRYIEEHNEKAIVLAGRPYHIDKEINHGIDTMINSLGLAVLTEDSICHLSKIESKLRVIDQWAYHSRIYHASDVVARHKNIELVNLNSFGCGLDAIVTDQAEEILKNNNKLFTTIKIDEINNLGAAKIRIRSLIASMNKRDTQKNYKTYEYTKNYFKEEHKEHTILFPDMAPYHMPLFESALNSEGYKAVYLKESNDNTVETGLKYVNNDACYPAIIVTGQLITALKSGEYDLNNTSVIITQTGGGCRATNYIGLIRKALKDANLEQIPVISLNFSGLEGEQAFHWTPNLLNKVLQAVVYGDLLMKLTLATRPYEKEQGKTEKIYNKWHRKCYASLSDGNQKEFKNNCKKIIEEFNKIPIIKKELPKVGIVGEILIKYHTFGNDNLVGKLEQEGAEVFVPELMGFVKYCAYNNIIKEKLLKKGKKLSVGSAAVLKIIDYYEKTVRDLLKDTRYRNVSNIYELANNVNGILSTGNQTGEGWFLTAEMVELIKDGINNIVCVQPFACLPNHIVGKSVIKKIRTLYKDSNIVAIDYDPGASHTNQVNRIKLMLTVAKDNLKSKKN
ncbi:MAG: 2-hydroxyglutaryl-CoA dehydratase [Firmicutes bacterium]|nr:2-hydroxyglutaryl-CoA dehydratase [Bacillota bacterium]